MTIAKDRPWTIYAAVVVGLSLDFFSNLDLKKIISVNTHVRNMTVFKI